MRDVQKKAIEFSTLHAEQSTSLVVPLVGRVVGSGGHVTRQCGGRVSVLLEAAQRLRWERERLLFTVSPNTAPQFRPRGTRSNGAPTIFKGFAKFAVLQSMASDPSFPPKKKNTTDAWEQQTPTRTVNEPRERKPLTLIDTFINLGYVFGLNMDLPLESPTTFREVCTCRADRQ